jgi:N-terminal acetyltransferase B complex non-catalytic subunit
MLNLTSLAATAITPLNVKEIQVDTIAHLFWARISIAHPFDSAPKLPHLLRVPSSYTTPITSLQAAYDWFGKTSTSIARSVTNSIEDTPFDKFLEFNTFRQKTDRSFSFRMYLLELRRLEFMKDGSNTLRQKSSIPNDFLVGVEDNRDFKTIPSFEYGKIESFDNFVTTKPKPMVILCSGNFQLLLS